MGDLVNAVSPAEWPWASLRALYPSRSCSTSARNRRVLPESTSPDLSSPRPGPVAGPGSRSAVTRSVSRARLPSPVNGSWVAWCTSRSSSAFCSEMSSTCMIECTGRPAVAGTRVVLTRTHQRGVGSEEPALHPRRGHRPPDCLAAVPGRREVTGVGEPEQHAPHHLGEVVTQDPAQRRVATGHDAVGVQHRHARRGVRAAQDVDRYPVHQHRLTGHHCPAARECARQIHPAGTEPLNCHSWRPRPPGTNAVEQTRRGRRVLPAGNPIVCGPCRRCGYRQSPHGSAHPRAERTADGPLTG